MGFKNVFTLRDCWDYIFDQYLQGLLTFANRQYFSRVSRWKAFNSQATMGIPLQEEVDDFERDDDDAVTIEFKKRKASLYIEKVTRYKKPNSFTSL